MNSLIKVTKAYKCADFASVAFVPAADLDKWKKRNWKPEEGADVPADLVQVTKKYADPAFATVAFVPPADLPKWQRAYWAVPAKAENKVEEKAPEAPPAGADSPPPPPAVPTKSKKRRARK